MASTLYLTHSQALEHSWNYYLPQVITLDSSDINIVKGKNHIN